jgi:ABC-type bacteriocin/lantibiotic exporter with double-glycine peptidase domain
MRYGLASLNIIYKDLNIPVVKTSNEFFREKKLSFKSNIILKNLEYSYPNINKKVLDNINLEIKSNSTIGLIGESGSGKTTLIDLIIGILNPSKGDIFVDDSNIKNNKRLWQNNIGYIPQFIYLIDDSIKKNIALGVREDKIDEKKIIESIKISQMESFVKELPNKTNTKIGELGVRLSGGQRQRIGIARALYFDPNLLVLDEATSSLDDATEKEIIDSINHMRGKKTIIISSHKKSILKECDEIFEISDKKIAKRT